jgi:hypothetical protein
MVIMDVVSRNFRIPVCTKAPANFRLANQSVVLRNCFGHCGSRWGGVGSGLLGAATLYRLTLCICGVRN